MSDFDLLEHIKKLQAAGWRCVSYQGTNPNGGNMQIIIGMVKEP